MTCRSCGAEGAEKSIGEPRCVACAKMLHNAINECIMQDLARKLELLQIEGEIQAQGGRSH